MKSTVPGKLCIHCGLCCDGSLFADLELAGSVESSGLEAIGLEIEEAGEDNKALLPQPCSALSRTRCSIYPFRPDCCRTFTCLLLKRVERGELSLQKATQQIQEARQRIKLLKKLLFRLGVNNETLSLKERCLEALAPGQSPACRSRETRLYAELRQGMASLEDFMQRTFLRP